MGYKKNNKNMKQLMFICHTINRVTLNQKGANCARITLRKHWVTCRI